MQAKGSRGPLLWPLALVIVGVLILLHNFLLLGSFNLVTLWPLLLVLAGAQILLRGDLLPSGDGRTFAITRGSVESATLEISAGEIDVRLAGLQREGRLIAGQYAYESRPDLQVNETHAHLRLDRASTPWMSFAEWEMGLSPDLPWEVFISTHLGQAQVDLSNVIVQEAQIATGIGDIRLTAPREAFSPLRLQSSLADIHVSTPDGAATQISVVGPRTFRVHADETRYDSIAPGLYRARNAVYGASLVEIEVRGTFGDAYLS